MHKCIIACCFVFQTAFAQNHLTQQAHQWIDTLASPFYAGRGYVDSGDWKAAQFVAQHFRDFGLKSFLPDFFQSYQTNVNTFSGKMSLKIGHRPLTPGKDFLIDAASSGVNGKFKTDWISNPDRDTSINGLNAMLKKISGQNRQGKVIAFCRDSFSKKQYEILRTDLIGSNCFQANGCVEFTSKKLTWDASTYALPFFYFQVHDSLPEKKHMTVKAKADEQMKFNYVSRNVVGYMRGTSQPDSFIVFTCHLDHLGKMGESAYFPGANDNASGTAMIMSLANYFSVHPAKYSVAFMAFSGEELGLVGSTYYVNHPLFPLTKIKFLVNLDIVGTGEDGIKVVNATIFPQQFQQLVNLNDSMHLVKQVSPRGIAANSDHYSFYQKQVPCFFIYTMGGIAAYHDIYDRSETLPLFAFENLYQLLITYANAIH